MEDDAELVVPGLLLHVFTLVEGLDSLLRERGFKYLDWVNIDCGVSEISFISCTEGSLLEMFSTVYE